MVGFSRIAMFLDDLGFTDVRTFNLYANGGPAPLSCRKLMIAAAAPR